MALLTAEQIASVLEAETYSEELAAINPFVILDETRREYPSIDVENVTGQESIRDVPTTSDRQTYLVHLYYRTTGFGDADEPNVKLLENEIFAVIDALQDTDTKISITESWDRAHPTDPTPHIHSKLRVVTEEISSTKQGGITGDQITISLPTMGVFDVINLITDGKTSEKDVDITSMSEEVFTQKYLSGLLDVSVVLSASQELQLDALISVGDDISITLTKGGIPFVKTANLITYVNSAPRKQVQTTIISMNIKP